MKKIAIALAAVVGFGVCQAQTATDFFFTTDSEKQTFAHNNPIPEKYELKGAEKKKAGVLKCVRSILQKGSIAADDINSSYDILNELSSLGDSESDLVRLKKQCAVIQRSLNLRDNPALDKHEALAMTRGLGGNGAASIIEKMINVENECVLKRVYGQAAMLLGAKVGFGVLVCQGSDARKRKFVGPSIGVATNFGADVGYQKVHVGKGTPIYAEYGAEAREPKVGPFGAVIMDKTSNYAAGLGKSYQTYSARYNIPAIDSSDPSIGASVGASSLTGSSVGVKLRIFNGKDNWKELLDLL